MQDDSRNQKRHKTRRRMPKSLCCKDSRTRTRDYSVLVYWLVKALVTTKREKGLHDILIVKQYCLIYWKMKHLTTASTWQFLLSWKLHSLRSAIFTPIPSGRNCRLSKCWMDAFGARGKRNVCYLVIFSLCKSNAFIVFISFVMSSKKSFFQRYENERSPREESSMMSNVA